MPDYNKIAEVLGLTADQAKQFVSDFVFVSNGAYFKDHTLEDADAIDDEASMQQEIDELTEKTLEGTFNELLSQNDAKGLKNLVGKAIVEMLPVHFKDTYFSKRVTNISSRLSDILFQGLPIENQEKVFQSLYNNARKLEAYQGKSEDYVLHDVCAYVNVPRREIYKESKMSPGVLGKLVLKGYENERDSPELMSKSPLPTDTLQYDEDPTMQVDSRRLMRSIQVVRQAQRTGHMRLRCSISPSRSIRMIRSFRNS